MAKSKIGDKTKPYTGGSGDYGIFAEIRKGGPKPAPMPTTKPSAKTKNMTVRPKRKY